ncbi:hypothetical protein C7438_0691 [Brockia lithotrophica]|uniref:Uncharacterized protein n=2 Tax=Brockia lithotrophica TaxID=933949 RepID=A0A660L6S6_9BACL|nr:hypothetical protein C7438_0691 [Brockia lithotrophica]
MATCELHLTSLRLADAPLAAMAAYGLLRIATEEPEFQNLGAYGSPPLNFSVNRDAVRIVEERDDTQNPSRKKVVWFLRWERDNSRRDDYAVLIAREVSRTSTCLVNFLRALKEMLDRRDKDPWSLFVPTHYLKSLSNLSLKDVRNEHNKNTYDDFLKKLVLDNVKVYSIIALGRWLNDGKFHDTPLLTYAGQVDPFNTYKEILKFLKKESSKSLRVLHDALVNGSWRFLDDVPSFRFHPSIVQEDAYISYEASGRRLPTEAVGEWLAFESLPLYVTYLTRGRRDLTLPGVIRQNGNVTIRFPIWRAPLSLPALRSLLHLVVSDAVGGEDRRKLGIIGEIEVPQYRVGRGGYKSVATPVYVV